MKKKEKIKYRINFFHTKILREKSHWNTEFHILPVCHIRMKRCHVWSFCVASELGFHFIRALKLLCEYCLRDIHGNETER